MLIRLAALGALAYGGYRYYEKQKREQNEAFADGQAGGENFAQVRNAGPNAMRDPERDTWDMVDEESDQATPASDPPANY